MRYVDAIVLGLGCFAAGCIIGMLIVCEYDQVPYCQKR